MAESLTQISRSSPASILRRLSVSSPTLLIYGARMSRAALGFLIGLLVARWLGPDDFGLFTLYVTVTIVVYTLLGEGLDPALVRMYAGQGASVSDRERSDVLASGLALRILITIPILIVGWASSDWIAVSVLGNSAYLEPLRLGLACAGAAALWGFGLAVCQAREQFLSYALLDVGVNSLRTLVLPALFVFGVLSISPLLWSHAAAFLVCAALGLWMQRRAIFAGSVRTDLMRRLFGFSKWTAAGNFCFVVQANVAIPALSYFHDPAVVGSFAAGAHLLIAIDQITIAILVRQLPAVSRLQSRAECLAYVKRFLPRSLAIAALLLPIPIFADTFVTMLYGASYGSSAPILQILFAGFVVTLITHPLYLVFYAINEPHLYAATAVGSLVAWIAAGMYLIPEFSAVGAAEASLIARLVQGALICLLLWYALRNARKG